MKRTERVVSMSDKCMLALLMCLAWAALAMMPLHPAFAAGTEVLLNPSFTDPDGWVPREDGASPLVWGYPAKYWTDNSYEDDDEVLDVEVDYRPESVNVHDVGNAQKIEVSKIGAGGGVQFLQDIDFTSGYYVGSVYLKAAPGTSMNVSVGFRQNAEPYAMYGEQTIALATHWKKVTLVGKFSSDVAGRLQIKPLGIGTLYVDNASVLKFPIDEAAQAIQAAVDANVDYCKITLSAGTYEFGANASAININRPMTISGTRNSNGTHATNLRRTAEEDSPRILMNITMYNVKVTDLYFVGSWPSSTNDDHDVGIFVNNGDNFNILGCAFRYFGESGITTYGVYADGVISNCDFTDIYRSAIANLGYGVNVNGGGNPAFDGVNRYGNGSSDQVFVEDSRFTNNRHAIASSNGSEYVFRHNTVTQTELFQCTKVNCGHANPTATHYTSSPHFVDAHGVEYGGTDNNGQGIRGSRSYAIYNNVLTNTVSGDVMWAAISIRGGNGVIYNNTINANTHSSGGAILLSNCSPSLPYGIRTLKSADDAPAGEDLNDDFIVPVGGKGGHAYHSGHKHGVDEITGLRKNDWDQTIDLYAWDNEQNTPGASLPVDIVVERVSGSENFFRLGLELMNLADVTEYDDYAGTTYAAYQYPYLDQ